MSVDCKVGRDGFDLGTNALTTFTGCRCPVEVGSLATVSDFTSVLGSKCCSLSCVTAAQGTSQRHLRGPWRWVCLRMETLELVDLHGRAPA